MSDASILTEIKYSINIVYFRQYRYAIKNIPRHFIVLMNLIPLQYFVSGQTGLYFET